ncbi:response regulator [Iodidimonas sp. SYSU 1G8]|uniref:response regulator n=1 Tax=Iodidimonas sp. SYSU 1G8 TaxID=3133967 RepID=UPI0031FE6E2E
MSIDLGSSYIVLVVDDSPETLSLLTDTLEDAGITALVARSGGAALSLIERVTPDVILMDAMMPEMDGFEACRRIKQNKATAHVPVIFMTGLTDTEHVVMGLEAGGVDYVTKPVAPFEMLARIRVHLANSRMQQSARIALDVAGRTLLAVNRRGDVLWSTPQAAKLLERVLGVFDTDSPAWQKDVRPRLGDVVDQRASDKTLVTMGSATVQASYLGEAGAGEFLLHLGDGAAANDHLLLKQRLDLTAREAEVLLWTAQGKSNRDIAEILQCSPRTVNKHLEQIYSKLGVENRTAAAAIAVRLLIDK